MHVILLISSEYTHSFISKMNEHKHSQKKRYHPESHYVKNEKGLMLRLHSRQLGASHRLDKSVRRVRRGKPVRLNGRGNVLVAHSRAAATQAQAEVKRSGNPRTINKSNQSHLAATQPLDDDGGEG